MISDATLICASFIRRKVTPAMNRTTLKKKQFIKRIIGIEIIGFLSAISIIWIDEILDLPYIIFGALATPINYLESTFESAVIALLGGVIILMVPDHLME